MLLKVFSKRESNFISIFIFGMLIFSLNQTAPNSASDVTELELILKLNENPDTLILDIRWEDVYQNGHLKGAILIQSGLSEPNQHKEADKIIKLKRVNKTQPIATLCNCEDGGFAKRMEQYLNTNGYLNTFHLSTSFSTWTNTDILVGGPDPDGFPVTGIPDLIGIANTNPFNDIGFIFLIAIVGGIGGYFIYTATQKPVNKDQLRKSIKASENKKDKRLKDIKELVSDKLRESSGKKKTTKQTRRRRR